MRSYQTRSCQYIYVLAKYCTITRKYNNVLDSKKKKKKNTNTNTNVLTFLETT